MPLQMGTNPAGAMMGGPPGGAPPLGGARPPVPGGGMGGGQPPMMAALLAAQVRQMAADKDRSKMLINSLITAIKKLIGDSTVKNPEVVTHLSRAFGPINAALKALDKEGPVNSPQLSSLLSSALMGGNMSSQFGTPTPMGGVPGQ